MPLDKTFDPAAIEQRLYALWEESGVFTAGRRPDAKPYTIMLPPPNVTGSLHIGHALNHSLIDVLIRFKRMTGHDTLWMPGTDHAGIATQLVVERQLREQQTSRAALGREEFVKRVWAWKEVSGGTITRQMRRLGASCDWTRERFTMDEGLSKAVLKVFVDLHKQGLIYKDKRLVNWDPSLQTAVSDLEVEAIEVKGNLWHLKYPLADDPGVTITVATTRPETMLGDTAVAVHPQDERYTHLVGKMVRLPLVGRLIPIVADAYADKEKGSGAVKITPAHDFNDFEVGKRHGLEMISILDKEARVCAPAPEAFIGLSSKEARKRVVEEFEALGLLEKIEPIVHAVPHDEKSGTVVIEPLLTEQWYMDVRPLAETALAAVRSGETKFVPQNWEKTYFRWLENIQPWCVSRQLWWGHQIPAWVSPDGTIFVEESEAEAMDAARAKFGKDVELTRDPDVLDTWFSSALWPFSTLGWPEETPDLKRYYPGDVLVTMFDIIFFWVARMMMTGTHFLKSAPFHTVLINARVVDEKGKKMSKTAGNVIDPLTLIDQYGADALRFALLIAATPGRDLRMGPSVVESYRNFCTKLWNAARFMEMNGCKIDPAFDPAKAAHVFNRWIVGETVKAEAAVRAGLDAYRFNDAATSLYQFVWNVTCDWYLELIKPVLNGSDEAAKAETRATASWVLDQILKLLHPFAPFITEELWAKTAEEAGVTRETMLIEADWPAYGPALIDASADAEINTLIATITALRSLRSEMNVPAGAKLPLLVLTPSSRSGGGGPPQAVEGAALSLLQSRLDILDRLGRVESLETAAEFPRGTAQTVVGDLTLGIPLEGVIDMGKEAARLKKDLAREESEIAKIDGKLGNPAFLEKAAPEVVEEQRERRADAAGRAARLKAALSAIS
jgi:valyl-tRNA synthetase